jgi:hypothetical protein
MPSSLTIASPAAFLHGQRGTPKAITIEVRGCSKREGNETFYQDLFGNSGNS